MLIVKSPSDNKEQKQFLGYEWSAAKGNEGIKLTTDAQGKHLTPLYDPENRYNRNKINALVQENFSGNPIAIPESLQTYASLVNLVDLLDFSRKDFDKHISLSVKKTVSFEFKWDLVKLGDICSFEYGKPLPEDNRTDGKYPVMGSNGRVGFHNKCLIKGPSIIIGRKGSAGKVIWENVDCFPIDTTFYVTLKNNNVLLSYLFLALKQLKLDKLGGGTGVPGLNRNEAYQLKIPLPPLEIQAQIAQECNAIDADVEAAQASMAQAKKELKPLLKNDKFSLEKLENVAVKVNEQIDPNNFEGKVNYIGLENIESQTGRLVGDIRANYNQIKSAKTCFKINDVLYGKLRPNLNKVYLAKEDGICSTDILVFRFKNEFLAQYYAHYLLSDEFNKEVLKGVKGQQLPRTSWKHLSFIKVPYPNDLNTQQQLITEIAVHETNITAAQKIIDEAASKKQAILKKYL